MSSVSGLLVPNNFDIKARSITVTNPVPAGPTSQLYSASNTNIIDIGASGSPSTGQTLVALTANIAGWSDPQVTATNTVALTNKNLTDQSNFANASNLWSGSGTNAISIRNGPNPTAGQVLTATSPTTATWQQLPQNGTSTFVVTGSTPSIPPGAPALIGTFTIPAIIQDSAIMIKVVSTGKGSPAQPFGFVTRSTFHYDNPAGTPTITQYGQIVDNYSGTIIDSNPTLVVSATPNTFEIRAGDIGVGTIAWKCVVTVYRLGA